MRTTLLMMLAAACTFASAQTVSPKGWAGIAATTRFSGTGATLSYGQRDLLGDNTDARFSSSYYSLPAYAGYYSFELEAEASALSAGYEPDTTIGGLFIVPYGGIGPRLLVRAKSYDYEDYYGEPAIAVVLNVGTVGGLEARIQRFGISLEFDVSLPALGLVGSQVAFFPFSVTPLPKLTLGANYYF